MTALHVVEGQTLGGSLPAEVTTYVGRDSEIREAKRLLDSASVVTLTGPGGVGKTRLGMRVAAELRPNFRDGALIVPLAELHGPELLASTLAERLGLGDRSARPTVDVLIDALRERSQLIVLDNCEHLVDACAQLVDRIARTCPGVVVLATSRQSLGVAGERIMPVPPLGIPEPGEPAARLDHFDAVRLFVDRATAVVPTFEITEENAADVVQLCRQLEGLPLAIELAAVRLRALSVRQIADRLDEQFTLLTGGGRRLGPNRHETLRALIDWSYELCTEPERMLWARLSVFASSFDLDAAEAVCSGDGLDRHEVLDVLDGLLDKSILLREEQRGVVRYRMLETMRQYGEDRLVSSGDVERMRRKHRDWYRELAGRFAAKMLSPEQLDWIGRVRREHANIRVALDFCTSGPEEAVIGLEIVYAIKEYWLIRGMHTEGRIHLSKLIDAAPSDAVGHSNGQWMYSFLALLQDDIPAHERALDAAAAAAERAGDDGVRAYVLHVKGYRALIGNEMVDAAQLFGAANVILKRENDLSGELWSRYNLGISVALAGELDRGRKILRDCIEAYTKLGEVHWRSWALWSLGATEYLSGELKEAKEACFEVLRLQRLSDDQTITAFALTVTAGCAAHSGQDRRAACLFGAAATVWKSLGASPTHYKAFVAPMERDTEAVTGRLGYEEAGAEFARGYTMSLEAAVAYAMEDEPAPAAPVESPLTKREQQIAELVAKGMTNREIAQSLVIAQRTAETHVDHILTKLGFTNRAQIAAWVVDRQRG